MVSAARHFCLLSDTTSLDAFLAYAASWDAAFPSRIEGASAEEIDRVASAAGKPLPADYRRFLELLGRNDDGIVAVDEMATSASDVASAYATHTAPADSLILGAGLGDLELACIELAPPHRVWETSGGRKVELWAGSLRGLLFKNAFMRGTYRGYRHTISLTTGDRTPRLAVAGALAESLGLARLWFSDPVTLCFSSEDEAVLVDQPAHRGLLLRISTNRSAERLAALSRQMQSALGAPLRKATRP